jgi:hypothetical protein
VRFALYLMASKRVQTANHAVATTSHGCAPAVEVGDNDLQGSVSCSYFLCFPSIASHRFVLPFRNPNAR